MITQLASAADDIKVWNSPGFGLVKQYNPHRDNVASISWSRDANFLASASSAGDKVSVTYLRDSEHDYVLHDKDDISCVALNSNSRYVAGGGKDGCVHVWDLKTRTHKKSYLDHKKAVRSVQFNWNDTVIASGSDSGEIILHNVVSGQGCSPLSSHRGDAVHMVQYSCFRKSLLASVSEYGSVSLWDTNVKRKIHSFDGIHQAPATAITFSPHNQKLLISVGLDKKIVCYDVDDQIVVRTLTSESPLTSLDILHDGSTFVTGTMRGKVFLFDLRKGIKPIDQVPAHTCSVQALKFQHPLADEVGAKPGKHVSSAMKKSQSSSIISQSKPPNSSRPTPQTLLHETRAKSTSDMAHLVTNGRILAGRSDTAGERPVFGGSSELIEQPYKHQVNGRHKSEGDDEFFSPIREPHTSLLSRERPDGSHDLGRRSNGERQIPSYNTSDNFADGVFSPLGDSSSANYSGDSSSNSHPGSSSGQEAHSTSVRNSRGNYPGSNPRQTKGRHNNGGGSRKNLEHLPLPSMDLDHQPSRGSPMRQMQAPTLPTPNEAMPSAEHCSDTRERGGASFIGGGATEVRGGSMRIGGGAAGVNRACAEWEDNHVDDLVDKSDEDEQEKDEEEERDTDGREVGRGGLTGFQVEFVRRVVEDAVDDMKEDLRKDVLNLHMDMLKQFQIQQAELMNQIQQCSVNQDLVEEVQRLREENKRLKSNF